MAGLHGAKMKTSGAGGSSSSSGSKGGSGSRRNNNHEEEEEGGAGVVQMTYEHVWEPRRPSRRLAPAPETHHQG